jgi:hypothetical protein
MVTDAVRYAVIKGGANVTASQYSAIGSGPFRSNINFNIQVPSQETIVSRQVLLRTTLQFSVTATVATTIGGGAYAGPGAGWVFNYGGVDGFGPFPFHQMVNSTQWTINNNTISQNTRDLLAVLCRIHDKRYLHRYNGMTPTMFDSYGDYTTIPAGALNHPHGGFHRLSMDNDLSPRSTLPVTITASAGANYQAAGGLSTILVSVEVTEPVLVSPFIFAGDEGQGIYGIQNLNAVYNLSSQANTALRFSAIAGRYTIAPAVTFVGAVNPTLLFQFLTPHPSDLLPSRNVVPYYELPRFISTSGATFAPGVAQTITSSSLQLNQIPDKIYIAVCKPVDTRLVSDADAFLAIQSISVNWNNSSGLLASATQQDLWRMSVENGINMSWVEWSGQASVLTSATAQATIQTCGSVLCLEFGKDIELKDDYYAPGSLGNFQLQFNVSVENTGAAAQTGLQLITIVQNSGVFSLERGVSSSYLGILTKSDVLEASRGVAIAHTDAIRMVGGGKVGDFFKTIGSKLGDAVKSVAPALLPLAKEAGINLLKKKMGMGQSGGAKRDMGALEDRMY